MNEEQYAEVVAQLASNETEHKSFRRRLEDHDALLREQNKIVVAIEKQSNAIETMNTSMGRVESKVDSLSGRVDAVEKKPGEKWEKVTWEILKYVLLAIAGVVIGKFL
jgi:predicted  nucleic acid-binding Zn-ribbon protein